MIHLINFNNIQYSISSLISNHRSLFFSNLKLNLMTNVMAATALPREQIPKIILERLKIANTKD